MHSQPVAGSSAAAAQARLHGNLRFLLACLSSVHGCQPAALKSLRGVHEAERSPTCARSVDTPTFLGLRAAAAVAKGGRAEVCLGLCLGAGVRFRRQICDGGVVRGWRVLHTAASISPPLRVGLQRQSCRTQTHTLAAERSHPHGDNTRPELQRCGSASAGGGGGGRILEYSEILFRGTQQGGQENP